MATGKGPANSRGGAGAVPGRESLAPRPAAGERVLRTRGPAEDVSLGRVGRPGVGTDVRQRRAHVLICGGPPRVVSGT